MRINANNHQLICVILVADITTVGIKRRSLKVTIHLATPAPVDMKETNGIITVANKTMTHRSRRISSKNEGRTTIIDLCPHQLLPFLPRIEHFIS